MKKLIVSVLLLLLPMTANAAIAFDAKTDPAVTTATSVTFSHTTSGTNRILFGGFQTGDLGNDDEISGITYATVPMVRSSINSFDNDSTYLYVLAGDANVASGANNLVVTMAGNLTLRYSAISYNGAAGGYDIGTTDSLTATGTNPTVLQTDLTPVSGSGAWTVLWGNDNQGLDVVAGTGSTLRTTANGVNGFFDSAGIVTGMVSMKISVASAATYHIKTNMASFCASACSTAVTPDWGNFFQVF